VFDIGWQELFIVGLVAIIVVGPKELPRVLRTVTLGLRKIRGMARDFQDGIDELAREADLQDLRREIEESATGDFEKEFESIADPARELEKSVKDIGGSLNAPEPSGSEAADSETAASETATSGGAKPDAPDSTEKPAEIPAPAAADTAEDAAPDKEPGGSA